MSTLLTALRATSAYLVHSVICRLLGGFRPQPPAAPDYSALYTSSGFQVHTYGRCQDGDYIDVYAPERPFLGDNGRPKSAVFLHGFALGASRIYRAHLEHLVRQGYFVFFPNYQTGFCHFEPNIVMTVEQLLDEVIGEGLVASQQQWLDNAVKSVADAYARTGFGPGEAVDTYVYGHSLGGLFALSWPYTVKDQGYPENLLPLQVLTADPIPSTSGAKLHGKLAKLRDRLTDDVDISVTGQALTMPVAILHGEADWIVPKSQWDTPFAAIKTEHKRMFLSRTDTHGCPGHYANHEQATTDTGFFPPLLALLLLDGVGVVDNLDWRYLWSALDRVIRDGARADQLSFDLGEWSDGRPVKPVSVYLPRP